MMNILIIGNADSVWIKEYCACVLLKRDCEVTISSHYNQVFRSFYKENGIAVIEQAWDEDCNRIKRFFYFLRELRSVRKKKYDFIHVHFCSRYNLRLASFLPGTKIATFYGSDLFRISCKTRREVAHYLKAFEKIVLLNTKMVSYFESDERLKRFLGKVSVFDFGITNLYYLRTSINNVTTNECKRKFGIDSGKIVVAIGYNKSEAQQHNEVIRAIKKLPADVKKNMCLMFHMSYGKCSITYWEEFNRLLKDIGCEYVVVKDFLTEYNLAYLRMSVDIYINAQTTDALSATLLEYFYAGSIVISGSWLKYQELDNMQIKYQKFTRFEELPLLIINAINTTEKKQEIEHNRLAIWNNYSWDVRCNQWSNLYS